MWGGKKEPLRKRTFQGRHLHWYSGGRSCAARKSTKKDFRTLTEGGKAKIEWPKRIPKGFPSPKKNTKREQRGGIVKRNNKVHGSGNHYLDCGKFYQRFEGLILCEREGTVFIRMGKAMSEAKLGSGSYIPSIFAFLEKV